MAAYEALSGYRYIGECKITHYCCEKYKHNCGTGDGITASGLPVAPGMVAVDLDVMPLESIVVINGVEYLAWTMAEIKYIIPLAPITKKNSQQILMNKKTGKPFKANNFSKETTNIASPAI